MKEAASTRDVAPDDGRWLTVSQAAAQLGVSERTVQRQCKSGKLAARLETGADGAAWLVDSATLPPLVATGADNVPTGVTTAFESESAPDGNAAAPSVATLPTGAAIVPPRVATDESGGLLAHLQGENAFLRGAIEQHQRSEAELRSALREALRAMPKAIEARESPQELGQVGTGGESVQNVSQAPINNAMGKVSGAQKNAAQRVPKRAMRPLWKVILGIR